MLPAIVLIPLALALAAAPPKIVDRPISFGPERKALMLEYRRAHEDPKAQELTIAPRVIIVHHTAFETLEKAFAYFDRTTIEADRKEIARAGGANVSAHFLVDRDGTIYRLMPETWMARHCIGLNHISIGIENVGGTARTPLTDAQLEANARLIRELAQRFPITHVIGHHEYRRFEKHPYFVERDRNYRTEKIDPGPEFMKRLRAKIGDLTLQPW
jgi:N-acetyl-anhydromuramyl-L-alanine amidase AmpD